MNKKNDILRHVVASLAILLSWLLPSLAIAQEKPLLPDTNGVVMIDDVAEKLGLSKRTLQRKLSEENTTFQQQLNSTREMLAIHYIRNTDIGTNDIAFLLGYQEINSFLRAFTIWTGKSISDYKKEIGDT